MSAIEKLITGGRRKKRRGGEGMSLDNLLKVGGSEISGAITSPGVAGTAATATAGGRRSGKRRRKSGSRGGRSSRRGRRSRRR
jgi:hypothetical protein